ncbi:MAG TPA: acyl-CoA dehydrogenase family protein [Frankiaceae bacterium]|jgi:alkylation response protein AidB-like acyl-CoA dehydrogenase|nr:acyl-CoA dehydrogenase family protein [Frankiaceae bacterium]
MSFVTTDEQKALRQSVRSFLESKSDEAAVRTAMVSELGFDRGLWEQLSGQLGLAGLAIPEEYGGSGSSASDLAVVMSELGRYLVCTPYFASVILAANAFLESGDKEACLAYLPRLASGELIGALAVNEHTAELAPDADATTAESLNGQWHLRGEKNFVLAGLAADVLVVSAATPSGPSLFVVDATDGSVERTALSVMDLTRHQARVTLRQSPATLLGEAGAAGKVLARVGELAAVALASEQAGAAERCLEMSVDYAKTRYQFGRQIGSFQAIKHMCADMLLEVEAAKSAALYAAQQADEPGAEATRSAHLAKAYCSDAFMKVAADNVQIHGGIGFTWEFAAQLYYKRAKSSQVLLGTPGYHREKLATCSGL